MSGQECEWPKYCGAAAQEGPENFSNTINAEDRVHRASAASYCADQRLAALTILEVNTAISEPEISERAQQRIAQIQTAREDVK